MHPQLMALNESIFDKGIAESIIYYLILHTRLWPSTACCVKCIHYYKLKWMHPRCVRLVNPLLFFDKIKSLIYKLILYLTYIIISIYKTNTRIAPRRLRIAFLFILDLLYSNQSFSGNSHSIFCISFIFIYIYYNIILLFCKL